MHGEITYQPLRPGALPFGKDAEGPLYRAKDRQHTQEDLLAVDGAPPADAEDDEGYQHDDLVKAHDGSGGEGREPELRGLLLHGSDLVNPRVLHRRFHQRRVGGARAGDVRLRLEVLVHGVPHMKQALHLLEAVTDLGRLRLIEVVRIGADGVRYVCQEIQHAPRAAVVADARVRRRIPPAEHDAHGQRPEQFQDIQRLVLDHHLVGQTGRDDDREQRRQGHAHLEYPPVTTNYFKRIKPSETMR